MDKVIAREQWAGFCKQFTERNFQRSTQLQVLDNTGSRMEESGLPLAGIDLDTRDSAGPCVEILFGDEGPSNRHLSHTVQHVSRIVTRLGADGRDKVLEIEGNDDVKTLIHLQDLPVLSS